MVEHEHIFLPKAYESQEFTSKPGRESKKKPEKNPITHGQKLMEQWAAIWAKANEGQMSTAAVGMPSKDGVYIEFEGVPGHELVTESLEDRAAGIRLLNVYRVVQDDDVSGESKSGGNTEITRATVFIPSGKQHRFLKKLDEYAKGKNEKGKVKNEKLMRSVSDIHVALLDSFWRDDPQLMPTDDVAVWCEVWLLGTDEDIENRFREIGKVLELEVQKRTLRFPERTVILAKATREQLHLLLEVCAEIAELRRAKETTRFYLELDNQEQSDWVTDLRSRLRVNEEISVAVCVLDTGVNNGHLLLEPVIDDSDRHAIEPSWGVHDHNGHGTLMSGIAALGDLTEILQQGAVVRLHHCLESVKVLPPRGANDPDLYGEITIQGAQRATIQAPDRSRILCMAITADDRDCGRPTSWSAALDKLTSGYEDDVKYLFIVSAGNVRESHQWENYPASNLESSVQDPGQSWNALTVGAYTRKDLISEQDLEGYEPLAQAGELSPFSSTSLPWDKKKWPVKPDIVLEGGNLARNPDGSILECDDLSLLSTSHEPIVRQFESLNATSAATAQAAWIAAQIQTRYPKAWPETIRALMVHSAEWPDALKRQFLNESRKKYSKTEYGQLLRICGFGVPNLNRSLACASNSLTLISESEIQPYKKKENSSGYATNEMHLHRLPWPKEVLLSLGHAPVTLRITLSYFIEPGPGEVGWQHRYRYASHGLRFDLNSTSESEERFVKRLNAAAVDENEKLDNESGSHRWLLGANNRSLGSIHSDIWRGTAADVATCHMIGVYPIIGWWRERYWLQRWDRKTRYSLIVSLHTPGEGVDIYTPVATELGIATEIEV